MKYKRVLAILLAILTVFASPPPLSAAQPRAGDAAGHWAEAAINRGLSQGLVNMDADGLVKPDAYMTRAEFCYSLDRWISKNGELLRALGVKWKPFRPGTFYDLPTSHPFYINVRQVYGMWLIESDTLNFNPEGFMTRAGICYPWVSLFMMMESSSINRVYFAGLDEDAALAAFSDGGSVADEYRQAVAAMTDLNFISGYPTGAFNPDAYLTRAEAYSIFMTIEEQLATYVDGDRSLSLLRVSSSRSGADGLLIEVVGDNQGLTEDAAITLLYTTTPGVGVTPSNIHTLYANRVTVKITELLASGNSTANNYRVPLYLDESTTYYVHAMISDRGRTSEVLSCVVGGRESSAYAYNNGYTSGGALSFPVALPNEIRLLSASAPPTSAGTVDVSVAVNDAAISNNADVVITYTADTRRNMTEQELLAVMGTIGNGYNSVVKRISAMTERGAGVYSALADTLGPGVYTFYVMLRSGDYHTPIQSFMVLVTNPSGFSLVDAAGFIRNNDDGKPVGIDMRLTVSPQAAYRDTEVIYAYTLDENMRVDSTTIGQSAGGLTSVTATLGDMRALAPTIYAKDIDLSVNGPWYFHVMLRRGDEVSEIKSFTVMLQSGEPEPIIKDVTGIALDLPANLPPYSEEDGTKTLHVTAGQFMELHAVVTPFDAEDGAVTWSAEPVEDGVNSNYTLEFVRDESGEIIPEKEIAYRFIYFDEPGIVKITVETAGEEFKDSVIIVVDPVDSTPAEEIEQITPQRFNLFVYDVPDDPMYNEYEDNHINILWRPEPLGSEYLSAVWSKGEGDDDNDEIIKLDPNTGHVMAVGESKPDDDPDAEPGALKPVRVILTVTLKDGSTLEPSVWYVTVLRKQVDINAIELKIMAEDGDTPDELEIQVEQRHRLRIKPEPPQAAPNVTWHIRYEPGSEPGEGEDAPIIIDRDSGVVSVRGMGEAVVWAESTVYEGVISNELKIITKPIE
ncbi:MAG: S-layer homology domain-containing protein, partial [Clostridiales bacterium]|nr:S-layer homology domain-containing protein [Clostridiales bacterium]